jgi:hypothetical protein
MSIVKIGTDYHYVLFFDTEIDSSRGANTATQADAVLCVRCCAMVLRRTAEAADELLSCCCKEASGGGLAQVGEAQNQAGMVLSF